MNITYHEHEQQQHQQKQHGFCDCGRCKGPIFALVSCVVVVVLNDVFNGAACGVELMPRSRHPVGSSDTLQDMLFSENEREREKERKRM